MTGLVLGPDRDGRMVAIADGRIVAEAPAGAEVLACADGEIEPGSVCAHTHLYSGLAPFGMPPADPAPQNFVEILERIWWRLDRALDAEALRASARVYVGEALLAGTTALIDHHESPNLIEGSLAILADACGDLGIRAGLCYGATERNFGRDEAVRGLAECARITPDRLIRPLVGLHAGFTVSDDTVRAAGDLARELRAPLHVHLAEAVDDVADAKARGYAGALDRLIRLGAVPVGSIFAHGVHLRPDEVAEIVARGGWLVQNPRSNQGNRVGYAGVLAGSDRVALGTDGWPADMDEEERALARLAAENGDTAWEHRRAAGRRLVAELFAAPATELAPGGLADLVVREAGRVRHVVVDGRVVVRDFRLVGADLETLRAEATAEARRLWSRMAAL